jgi:cytochrome c556
MQLAPVARANTCYAQRERYEGEIFMRSIKLMMSSLVLVAAVAAHAATPDDTVGARKQNFKQIGGAMKAASETLKTPAPDLAVIRKSAATVAGLAPKVPTWFPAGTGPDKVKTGAKAEIWSDAAGFKAAAAALAKASVDYKAAADSGNLDAIKGKQMALGMTCKGCHDKYRTKD